MFSSRFATLVRYLLSAFRCRPSAFCLPLSAFCLLPSVSFAEPTKTLTLEEAVETALTHHPTVRIGTTAIEAAQARVRQEITGYLPRGAYTYSLSRQQRPVTSAVGGVQIGGGGEQRTVAQIFNFHSTNFSMSQLLFDFGRTLDTFARRARR
jgi:outer membrane protein